MFNVSLSSFLNISEEIRDLTANNIGEKVGTLGRHMEYWADIWYIGQISRTLGRYWGHWVEIGDIRQTLGRHWADIGFLVFLCKITLFDFLVQDKTFRFSYPR